MNISLMSAIIIQETEVEKLSNGPNDQGKWQGIISHSKNHSHHPYSIILSTIFCYNSSDEAITAMINVVEDIRSRNLFGENEEKF